MMNKDKKNMQKITSICILGILIMSFGTVALNSDVEELSETINDEIDNVADSEIAGYTHTVLAEYITHAGCGSCVYTSEALRRIYAGGEHPFYYITLATDKNVHALSRAGDYNAATSANWIFFDGGYQVTKGRESVERTMETCNYCIIGCGEREVPYIDVQLDVIWLENATMDIEATVNNNEADTYDGTIRVYVTELVSSMGWEDATGNLYNFPFLDYAFNENVSILSMDTWSDSMTWDGHNYNDGHGNDFGNITPDNIMVIAAVFNSEWHPGYPNDFDAYWGDDTTGFMIGDNNPPDAPIIDGTASGEAGVIYNYTFVVTDPNGDDVTFCVDWGDDFGQGCYGPYASGEEVNLSYKWDEDGTYIIKSKAADIHGAKSGWTAFEVTMPVNQCFSHSNTMDDIIVNFATESISHTMKHMQRPTPANHDDAIFFENFDGNWTYDPDGDPYMVPEGWDIDGICIGTQRSSSYPELTHYWSQFDDDDSLYLLTHSPPYCVGLWWSNGAHPDPPDGSQDEWLITPELNVSGYNDLQLEFYSIYTMKNYGVSPWAHDYVKASTDGGITWDIVGDLCHDVEFYFPDAGKIENGWNWNEVPVVIDLSAYDGCSSLMVAFNYEAKLGRRGIWMVDDVILTGELCYTEIEISGGLGVNAVIKNTGEEDITDLEYNIVLDGGLILLPRDGTTTGTVDIPADGEVSVKVGVIGLGKTIITVTAGYAEETTSGLIFLIFVKT